MTDDLQTTFVSFKARLCQNRRQRRRAVERAQVVLAWAENLLLVALFFVVFLYPLLLNLALLFNLSAWLWWVKGFAWIGLLAWAALRLLAGFLLSPAQITGATVEAMEQAAPDESLVLFPSAAETECSLFPWRQAPALVEQKTRAQAQWYGRQWWRRPRRRLLFDFLIRRLLPSPSSSLVPSA